MGAHRSGRLAEAERLYLQILGAEPASFTPRHMLGILRSQQGRHAEALELIGGALEIEPGDAEARTNYGSILKALGRVDEALENFDRALAAQPDFVGALYSRGVILQDRGRSEEALADFDRALAIQPDFAMALHGRGVALQGLARFEEALASYDRVLALRPDFAGTAYNRAKLLCEMGRIEEGFEAFRHNAAAKHRLRAASAEGPIVPHQARHDREQRDYLKTKDTGALFRLEPGARLAAPAIRPGNDIDAIAERWRTSSPQVVVIDDFLTDEALDGLRRFCLGSTIWKNVYQQGYLGAMPEDGFACPLLAQIAEELGRGFPAIFRSFPLLHLWGFKYDSQLTGINVHADEAAVNVNFWITPDEANLDPGRGGLVIWDRGAPIDWDFTKFNRDETAIRAFLRHKGAKSVTVPYRANRVVIFDSDLFHETDKFTFRDGYLNRRINITMLFGRRGSDRAAGAQIGPPEGA